MDNTRNKHRKRETEDADDGGRGEDRQHEVPEGPNCKCCFMVLLIEAVVHLSIYIYEMFKVSQTAKDYYEKKQTYEFIITVVCLIAPTVIYTLYEILSAVLSELSRREILGKAVWGLLLIPWQMKAHIDLLHFAAKQACTFRPLEVKEKQYLSKIKQTAFVLEFFVDFYVGFFQLLLQLHFLVAMVTSENTSQWCFQSKIVASSLAVVSFIKAFQRKDDGILTKIFSYIGWACFCASRVIALALLSVVIGYGGVLVVVLYHAAVATGFIFRIIKRVRRELRLKASQENRQVNISSCDNNCALATLAFFQFGLPSLMYWPMMFEFKKCKYVSMFFVCSGVENLMCFMIWFLLRKNNEHNHEMGEAFAVVVLILTFTGISFLTLYMSCKPEKTDVVALSHIRETNSNKYGIFFDFCNAVQVLPDTSEIDRRREQIARLRSDL